MAKVGYVGGKRQEGVHEALWYVSDNWWVFQVDIDDLFHTTFNPFVLPVEDVNITALNGEAFLMQSRPEVLASSVLGHLFRGLV